MTTTEPAATAPSRRDPSPTTAAETLSRWQADEASVRARLAEVGWTPPSQLAGRTGMEVFEDIFAGRLPSPAIGATLDFLPVHVEPGVAVFQGNPNTRHYNPMGGVHGGWFAAMLDSAVGCAVHSMLPAGRAYTTVELKINIVRGLTEAVPLVRAEGKVIHMGRQVATAEGRLVGHDGKLYAHASTTCLVFDAPAART